MPASAAEALPVVQRTPEWIEARQHGIGASEAAAALGLSRWESPVALWARKLGLVPASEPSIAMQLGTITEPLNALLYAEATGVETRRVNRLLRSRRHPFLLASLDRRRPDRRLVELKWTEHGDGYGEPGTDEVPDEVLCQVVQQMAVTDAPSADVSVIFGGRRHAVYTIARPTARDEAAVIARLGTFWRHVENRTEPPIDASDSTLEALRAIYPRDNGEALEAGPELTADLAAFRDVKRQAADLAKREKELYIRIVDAIGAASTVIAPGVGQVTYRAPNDSVVTDWKAVAAALSPTPELIAEHTTTKANSRRLNPTWKEEPTDAVA